MTDQTAGDSSPADQYGARCAEIEREYAEQVAQADGDYSRVQHFTAQIRSDLVNLAGRRRVAALEEADRAYRVRLSSQPIQTESEGDLHV